MFYFGNGIDKRTLYIVLIVVALVYLATSGTALLFQIVLTLPAVVIAMSFHEFAHAWVADKLGDYTPRSQGRLTLNPLAHIDPMGLILLFFVHIGWGKPVQINPNNFTSNKSRQTCEMLVSLAGPVMNFILAILFMVLYYFMGNFAPINSITEILMYLIQYTIILNIGLGVFNLIPLPPLDGEKIFRKFLPYSAIQWLDNNSNILQLIFFVLWFLGLLGNIVSPVISFLYNLLLKRSRSNFWSVFMKDILILGIESSCDETAVAVVKNGREILSNMINSQIKIHEEYGGVVPEIASRCHIEVMNQIAKKAIEKANISMNDIDAIAVTCGPGLVGALLVGVSYAKSLSFALNKPLIGVNHIAGHIAGNFMTHKELEPPFICLIISGGHTHLVNVKTYHEYEILGKTRDDAIGEAFDKVARVIGLGYPGGPKIDEKAKNGKPCIVLPITQLEGLDFSFSGIKTAVINLHHKNPEINKEDLCASFEETVTKMLLNNVKKAMKEYHSDKIVLAGGVSRNSYIRAEFDKLAINENVKIYYPEPILCTDNAAMIASQGYYDFIAGKRADLHLNAIPNLKL